MHIDGCHFFVWVGQHEDGTVTLSYDERSGDDLYLHARCNDDEDEPCARCIALRGGAKQTSISRVLADFPGDSKTAFVRVLEELATIPEAAA